MRTKTNRVLAWKPQLKDFRDFPPVNFPTTLSTSVDLRPNFPPVYDQGDLGSCTGNGNAAVYEFTKMKQGKDYFPPSRLGIYYDERVLENTINDDAGAQIRDGIKVMKNSGVYPESMWPYDTTKFTVKPPQECYTTALKNEIESYSPITQTLEQLKGCIASGYPVVFGVTLYDSFESHDVALTGNVPMPQSTESIIGGHCMVLAGFDNNKSINDTIGAFIVRNSWGNNWGDQGYCYIPYDYIINLGSDFWMIKLVD